jgi:hypothetical protein
VESTNGDNGDDNSGEDSNFSLYLIFIIIIILIILSIIIRFYFQKKSLAIEKEEQKKIQKEKRKTEQMKVSERSLKGSPSAKKSKKQELEGEGAQKLKSSSKKTSSRKDLIAEKKKILKAQDRIKKDYKEGLITKEMFDNLKNDYKQKLKVVNKKLEKMDKRTGDDLDQDYEDKEHSPELSKLIARKEKILKAINKLEDDRESGVLDEELYKEMVGTYKKQAIEILEMIDEIKGNK